MLTLNNKIAHAAKLNKIIVPDKLDIKKPFTVDFDGYEMAFSQAIPEELFKPGDVCQVTYNDFYWYTYVRGANGWLTANGTLGDDWMRQMISIGKARRCKVEPVE